MAKFLSLRLSDVMRFSYCNCLQYEKVYVTPLAQAVRPKYFIALIVVAIYFDNDKTVINYPLWSGMSLFLPILEIFCKTPLLHYEQILHLGKTEFSDC